MRGAKKPEISIIIPTFNEEKYIGAALGSIEKQEFSRPFEVIIGDGMSTDRTEKIAKDYGARVVHETYGTPSGGRHAASLVARGKILVFTGADVEVAPDWLAKITAPFADRKVQGALGSVTPLDGTPLDGLLVFLLRPIAALMNVIGLPYVYAENMACTVQAYEKSGGWDPKMVTSEDTDFAIRLRKCGRFVFAPEAKVKVSMRRVRKWGYLKYIAFHTGNFIRSHFLKTPADYYEPVR